MMAATSRRPWPVFASSSGLTVGSASSRRCSLRATPSSSPRHRRVRGLGEASPGSASMGGSKGGVEPPLVSRSVQHCVCWLNYLTVVQASPADARETLPARGRSRRWPGRPGQASRPLGHQLDGQRGRTGRSVTPWRRRSPARPGFDPTRTPRGPAIVALRRSHGP